MKIKHRLIHFLGGFTEEDIKNQIQEIQEIADKKIQDILESTERRINLISEIAENKIKIAEDNGTQLYYKGKTLGQYRAAAYFISYAKSLYGRKDWSSKMFDQMTKFLDDIEKNNDINNE